jgi:hypothetical protein
MEIMLVKGKAPKVSIAVTRREPVTDISEGRRAVMPTSQVPVRVDSKVRR